MTTSFKLLKIREMRLKLAEKIKKKCTSVWIDLFFPPPTHLSSPQGPRHNGFLRRGGEEKKKARREADIFAGKIEGIRFSEKTSNLRSCGRRSLPKAKGGSHERTLGHEGLDVVWDNNVAYCPSHVEGRMWLGGGAVAQCCRCLRAAKVQCALSASIYRRQAEDNRRVSGEQSGMDRYEGSIEM